MPHQLIEGLDRFRREVFPRYREHYERLVAEGQNPSTLFIGCSDSRVVPDLLTGSRPGDLFIVRNPGAFVPPFDSDGGFHETAAAIEFATLTLNVTDIVVCGHSHCGAVQALYADRDPATPHFGHWLELGREAMLDEPLSEPMLRRTEQRSTALQLRRLLAYPMVRERVEAGRLALHGWHYRLESGAVEILDPAAGEFVPASD